MIGYFIVGALVGAAGFIVGRDYTFTDVELLGKIQEMLDERGVGTHSWARAAGVEHRRLSRILDGDAPTLIEREALISAAQSLVRDTASRDE